MSMVGFTVTVCSKDGMPSNQFCGSTGQRYCVDLARVVQVEVERACVGAVIVLDDVPVRESPVRGWHQCQRALAGPWQVLRVGLLLATRNAGGEGAWQ